MSDTSYIDRMELEHKELHEKFEKLRNYLNKLETGEVPVKSNIAAPRAFYSSIEHQLMREQFTCMETYLRILSSRIQLAKDKERNL